MLAFTKLPMTCIMQAYYRRIGTLRGMIRRDGAIPGGARREAVVRVETRRGAQSTQRDETEQIGRYQAQQCVQCTGLSSSPSTT